MNKHVCSNAFLFIGFLFLVTNFCCACSPKGQITGEDPPPGKCNTEDSSDCCSEGNLYDIYDCSPRVSNHTKANLTLKHFDRGGNGGGPSLCDHQYHSDDELLVELSTGWFKHEARCNKYIQIHRNGKSVMAKVIDVCDSSMGCDIIHDFEPPCGNNILRASKAVWVGLGLLHSQSGSMKVHWADAARKY